MKQPMIVSHQEKTWEIYVSKLVMVKGRLYIIFVVWLIMVTSPSPLFFEVLGTCPKWTFDLEIAVICVVSLTLG